MSFKKLTKEISNIDREQSETEKYLKETAFPILKIAVPYLIVIYVYCWVFDNYGLEKVIITLGVALLFTLRSLTMAVSSFERNRNSE